MPTVITVVYCNLLISEAIVDLHVWNIKSTRIHKASEAALISFSLAFSGTPVYTAGPWILEPGANASRNVCLRRSTGMQVIIARKDGQAELTPVAVYAETVQPPTDDNNRALLTAVIFNLGSASICQGFRGWSVKN